MTASDVTVARTMTRARSRGADAPRPDDPRTTPGRAGTKGNAVNLAARLRLWALRAPGVTADHAGADIPFGIADTDRECARSAAPVVAVGVATRVVPRW